MGWFRRLRARIKYRHFDRDLAREVETHRALKADEYRDHGLAADDARDAAARDLGNVTLMREDARGVWIAPWLQSVWQDLRYAAASYRRQPLFTTSALLVLSCGTGLVTVAFSLAHATFLRPWQVPDPSSVVLLRATPGGQQRDFSLFSLPEFNYFREHATSINVFFAERSSPEDVVDDGRNLGPATTLYVSSNYFAALRIDMRAGRTFTAAEDDYRAPELVAVIGDRLWRDRFGRDPKVIGKVVSVGRRQFTIVGVAASSSLRDGMSSVYDIAMPLAAMATERRAIEIAGVGVKQTDPTLQFTDPRQSQLTATIGGRLAAGVTAGTAAAELTTLSGQFRSGVGLPLISVTTRDTRPLSLRPGGEPWLVARLVLLALALVLGLACANVGNMLLARGLARRREIGVRLALGASRARLVRQLMTETGALALVAAVLGLAITAAMPAILSRVVVSPAVTMERPEFFAATAPVFWFAAGIAILTTLLCGLAPALRVTRLTVSSAMDRQGSPVGRVRLRRLLLAAQLAMATTLLTGAGLLTRATAHALEGGTGFDLDELQVVTFALPRSGPVFARAKAFFSELDRSITAAGVPAALMDRPPIVDDRSALMLHHPNEPREKRLPYRALEVSPSYFAISGVTLTSGRAPQANPSAREIVVSQAASRKFWPDADPIGRTLIDDFGPAENHSVVVVGVATDAALNELGQIEPAVYLAPDYFTGVLLVRDRSDSALERVRALATAIEPTVTIAARPLRTYASDSIQIAVAGGWVAWAIGGLGLVVATLGAAGVFGYAVEERRREIGVRLALGARPGQVVLLILRTSQGAALTGVIAGMTLSMAAAPMLSSFLYGLSPFDPIAYAQIAIILLAAAAIATWAPARRATRINPVEALRVD